MASCNWLHFESILQKYFDKYALFIDIDFGQLFSADDLDYIPKDPDTPIFLYGYEPCRYKPLHLLDLWYNDIAYLREQLPNPIYQIHPETTFDILKNIGINYIHTQQPEMVKCVWNYPVPGNLDIDKITKHFSFYNGKPHAHRQLVWNNIQNDIPLGRCSWRNLAIDADIDHRDKPHNFVDIPIQTHIPKDEPFEPCFFNHTTYSMLERDYISTAYNICAETVYFTGDAYVTEKTFKTFYAMRPAIWLAPAGTLKYLRSQGFKTHDYLFDESYDNIQHDVTRLEFICKEIQRVNSMPLEQLKQILFDNQHVLQYNFNYITKHYMNFLEQDFERQLIQCL